jgi:SAM-dependent methyltransferase
MDFEKAKTLTLSILKEAPAYHEWIFEELRPWLGETVLEVGCGMGHLTNLLLRQKKVIASDINEDYLKIVGDRFQGHPNLKEILLWDIRCLPPYEFHGPIDSIVCSNVLEHIEDDEKTLGYFHQILPPGGRIILLVPALKWLYNALDQGLGHFRRYSRRELHQKLETQGFKVSRVTFLNELGISGWFLNGTILRRRLLPARQVRIFNKMVPFFILFEKAIPTVVGQSLIAIGEKE